MEQRALSGELPPERPKGERSSALPAGRAALNPPPADPHSESNGVVSEPGAVSSVPPESGRDNIFSESAQANPDREVGREECHGDSHGSRRAR